MTNTIFDLVDEDLPKGQKGYLELAAKAPKPKDESYFSDISDYAKTAVKGIVEGTSKLGEFMSFAGSSDPFRQISKKEREEQRTDVLDRLLPTEEGYAQKGLRRGLNEAPSMLALPGSAFSTIPRSLAAGYLEQGAEEYGAPEWLQTMAGITAYLGPEVTKKLLEKGSNKEIIKVGRKLGLSDEAITPLIQSDNKLKWFSKLANRRGKTKTALNQTKGELDSLYGKIAKSSQAKGEINTEAGINFLNKIEKTFHEMPSGVREKVTKDWHDLIYKGNLTGDNLINFWVDVNHELGPNTKQLANLKEPIREALKEISPKLAEDFKFVNAMLSKYHSVAKKLEPNLVSDLIGAGESIGLLSSIFFGYYPTMLKFAGEKASRRLASEALTNPRFQQLGHKFAEAVNKHSPRLAKKISDLLAYEIDKSSPETAEKLEKISEKDFEMFFKNH